MPKTDRVAAVVVTYNRKELLRECLGALLRQKTAGKKDAGEPEEAAGFSLDILVVDNASTDGTKELLAELTKRQKHIRCLRLGENAGGAGGFCCGMKWAAEEGYDAAWIMDDDTIPNEDALCRLLEGWKKVRGFQAAREAGGIGYVSSRVEWTDGTLCEMNRQHFLKAPRKTSSMDMKDDGRGEEKNAGLGAGICRIDQATFVSLLFPTETIKKIGLPIKEYFIWGDDKEYTLRAAAQFPCYYIPDSVVIHKMAGNTGSNITFDGMERIPRYYYAYRNDFATARSRGLRDLAVYFAAFGLNLCRILLRSPNHKAERMQVMRRGLSAGLKFHPVISFAERREPETLRLGKQAADRTAGALEKDNENEKFFF